MAVYPPILSSTITPFSVVGALVIPYKISSLNSLTDVKHIGVKVSKLSTNQSVISGLTAYDNVYYTNITASEGYITISTSDLSVENGEYYRVQLRAGANTVYSVSETYANWYQDQVSTGSFSDWSTTAVTRAIYTPVLSIGNGEMQAAMFGYTESTTSPLFVGQYKCQSNESVESYKFDLYSDQTTTGELIESSGWITRDRSADPAVSSNSYSVSTTDSHRFNTTLKHGEDYYVLYDVNTVNGALAVSANYYFKVAVLETGSKLDGYTIEVYDDSVYAMENACMEIVLSTDSVIARNLVISRSNGGHDFAVWEDIKYIAVEGRKLDSEIVHRDYTIESGVQYKYRVQIENVLGERSAALYENGVYDYDEAPARECNFSYAYLLNEPVQLALKYDNTITSFQHTTLTTKQDGLGGKYPTILRNGDVYYAQFGIGGTISFMGDEYCSFFEMRDDGYYYDDTLVVPRAKYVETVLSTGNSVNVEFENEVDTFNTNLTDNNIFIERKFREKVEEFLNNGDYKLYRSATEGNILVTLTDVTLSPQQTLGRMIYSFSATAYEVLDNTLLNLNEYDVIDIGEYTDLELEGLTVSTYSQISGWYSGSSEYNDDANTLSSSSPDNLMYYMVSDANNHNAGDVTAITGLTIEPYPQVELTGEVLAAEAAYEESPTPENLDTYTRLTKTKKYIDTYGQPSSVDVTIDGKLVKVEAGRHYTLKELDLTADSSIALKTSAPVIIDYSYDYTLYSDLDTSSYSISTFALGSYESQYGEVSEGYYYGHWGQLNGLFTTSNTEILASAPDWDGASLVAGETGGTTIYSQTSVRNAVIQNMYDYVDSVYGYSGSGIDWSNYEIYDGYASRGFFYIYSFLTEAIISCTNMTKLEIYMSNSDSYIEVVISPGMPYHYKSEDDETGITDIVTTDGSMLKIDFTAKVLRATRG